MTRADEALGPGCRQRTVWCPAVADDLVPEHVRIVLGGVECHRRPGQWGAPGDVSDRPIARSRQPLGDLPRQSLSVPVGHLHELHVRASLDLGDEATAP